MSEVNAKNEKEYKARAKEFLSTPLTGGIDEMITPDGHRYRYDWKTNEFGVANTLGNVSTYYKPKGGAEHWKEKVEKYGKR